ncbi:MAG: hypothetical protein SGILL_008517 [Bacillariaceae sp.]
MTSSILSINREEESHVVVSKLQSAMEDTNLLEVSFNHTDFDDTIVATFLELLATPRSKDHDGLWKNVSFFNCTGKLADAIHRAAATNSIARISLVRNLERLESYEFLRTMLQATTSLRSLRISIPFEAAEDAAFLADGLQQNTSLESVDFRWSAFDSDECVVALSRGLAANQTLTHLHFSSCSLSDDQIYEVCSALRDHPNLETLDLESNNCGDKGGRQIAALLESHNCGLKELNLSFQQRNMVNGKLDCGPVIAALRYNKSLQSLHFTCNGLVDEDAEAIGQILVENSCLEELYLARNKLTDGGIKKLANHLPAMQGLKKLSLWGNKITEDGALTLLDGVKQNTDMQGINLFRQYRCSSQIQYYTNINRGGRRFFLANPNDTVVGICPHLVERVNRIKLITRKEDIADEASARADMIHYLLQQSVGMIVQEQVK